MKLFRALLSPFRWVLSKIKGQPAKLSESEPAPDDVCLPPPAMYVDVYEQPEPSEVDVSDFVEKVKKQYKSKAKPKTRTSSKAKKKPKKKH